MRQKSGPDKQPAVDAIKDIWHGTRWHFSERRHTLLPSGTAAANAPR